MKQASQMVEELLILNQQPMDEQTILGWRPFQQGSTLGDILNDYHRSCREAIRDNTPAKLVDCAQDQMPRFSAVQACPPADGLSAPAENETPIFKLERTKIILLDWEAVSNCKDFLVQLLTSLHKQKHFVHLILLGQQLLPDFSELFFESFLITHLNICQNQFELEKILRNYHQTLGDVWEKITDLSEIVTVKPFKTSLPIWKRIPAGNMAGLNEATFGINIEESFSRSLDESY
jgi:hypothetical protein